MLLLYSEFLKIFSIIFSLQDKLQTQHSIHCPPGSWPQGPAYLGFFFLFSFSLSSLLQLSDLTCLIITFPHLKDSEVAFRHTCVHDTHVCSNIYLHMPYNRDTFILICEISDKKSDKTKLEPRMHAIWSCIVIRNKLQICSEFLSSQISVYWSSK